MSRRKNLCSLSREESSKQAKEDPARGLSYYLSACWKFIGKNDPYWSNGGLKDFRKFQSDRKFMIAECAYTVPRELVSKNVILLLRTSSHFVQVTLCLLVAIEKLPARAVWRTTCWSYLMTTCRSIVTIYFMNCCE
jgi:hypothetical protein